MKRASWAFMVALCLGQVQCGGTSEPPFVRGDPPADQGVNGYANGCYAVEGFDGEKAPTNLVATASKDAFAFSEPNADAAGRFTMRATDLGTYLFYDQDRRYLVAEEGQGAAAGTWHLTRTDKLESQLTLLDDTFRSPAEWELQPSTRDPKRYQLKHYQTGQFLTLTGLTAEAANAAVITLYPKTGCAEFPEMTIDAKGDVAPKKWPDGDLYGIAEIHSHMMTSFGFGGGGTFHGAPFHRLGVERALPDCSLWHGDAGRKDVVGYFYDGGGSSLDTDALTAIMLSGEVPEDTHRTAGYPDFLDWPSAWRSSTHQTMYYRWLERAYLGGLRLMVQLATGNSVLCDLVKGIRSQTPLYSCNDMVSVDRSITEVRNLERYIDAQHGGPGKGWLRVVESPADARAVIEEGKMAVVLGIEISNLFDCFATKKEGYDLCTPEIVAQKVAHYHDLGVRVVFPVHKFDNGFTPGDGSDGVIELGNFINSGHYNDFVEDCPGPNAAFDGGDVSFGGLNKPRDDYDTPADVDMSDFGNHPVSTLLPYLDQIKAPPIQGNYCQHHGLTPLGETLITELIKHGMIVDVAHLPERSLGRAYEILEANDYPATKTHGESNMGRIYALGGMAGSGLGRCSVPGKPGGMGEGLKSAVAERVSKGGYPSEGLSFDLNGFAHGPRPRFGPDSPCGDPQSNPITYPFKSFDGAVTFEQPHLGNREVDFNTEGMIHIGLLPELIEDARRDGVTDEDLEPLFRSAESYLRLWERAEQRAAELNP